MLKHLDLFSGIGGFALACQWNGIETIGFVEIDKYCQKVLKKHWSNVPIVENINNVEEIKHIITNTQDFYEQRCSEKKEYKEIGTEPRRYMQSLLLSGGFPCQPFSNAGRKRGSSDERYLWPQTIAVIEAIKPTWIILENVPGILNMVFPDSEVRVASQASFCEVPNDEISDYDTISGRIERDLKQAGYETVWLIIPACSLNAPHRRDRVWIIANSKRAGTRQDNKGIWQGLGRVDERKKPVAANNSSNGCNNRATLGRSRQSKTIKIRQAEENKQVREGWFSIFGKANAIITNTNNEGLQGQLQSSSTKKKQKIRNQQFERLCGTIPDWEQNWYEVATKFCRMDDGIPNRVDRLKCLGNTIVPQVAYELIKIIKEIDEENE